MIGIPSFLTSKTLSRINSEAKTEPPGVFILKTIALAPSNKNYIYAATYAGLWVTKDNGDNWEYIKTGLPSGSISDVVVSNVDPERVFVTLSSYNENEKVYETFCGT